MDRDSSKDAKDAKDNLSRIARRQKPIMVEHQITKFGLISDMVVAGDYAGRNRLVDTGRLHKLKKDKRSQSPPTSRL